MEDNVTPRKSFVNMSSPDTYDENYPHSSLGAMSQLNMKGGAMLPLYKRVSGGVTNSQNEICIFWLLLRNIEPDKQRALHQYTAASCY